MNICVVARLKKFVYTRRHRRTHPEHGVECVGAHPERRYCAQIFKSMTLFLKRIFRRAGTEHCDFFGVYFNRICRNNRFYNRAFNFNRRAEFHIFGNVRDCRLVNYYLQVFKRGAVIQFQKCHIFRITRCADPAANSNRFAYQIGVVHNINNINVFHNLSLRK